MDNLLKSILVTKRAHNSTGELNFLKWLHDHLKDIGCKPQAMAEGCIVVENRPNKVLFSCHVDTVHSTAISDGSMQALFVDPAMGHVFLEKPESGCLGADDGAGVYVLLRMLAADVPGTYIFHRGEERGGIGANGMLSKHAKWLEQFTQCIAFDRAGKEDIILTQGGQMCASVAYGEALAKALAAQGLKYENCHKGSFTDSKVYRQIIRECTNLSVGYEQQHGPGEFLDYEHLDLLVEAAIKLEWAKLPVSRNIVPDVPKFKGNFGYDTGMDDDMLGFRKATSLGSKPKLKALPPPPPMPEAEDLEHMNYEEIFEWTADETLTEAICNLMVKNAELEARADMYRQLVGL